ncbi:hypothetical protein H0E87_007634 [Populus deltoides]|uniref:Uncharacterized protein n=2 Tax=Populus deltoides TaxID=3696 RepID=A0A8T2ZDB8_POPDE|nr:hypothetical protein H0E87_007634 [Populus deltoides]
MNGDRPSGESKGKYVLGFFMNIGGAALHGFLMPTLEFTFLKAGKAMTFDLVLQVQFIVSMFATLFCSISKILNKDFQNEHHNNFISGLQVGMRPIAYIEAADSIIASKVLSMAYSSPHTPFDFYRRY